MASERAVTVKSTGAVQVGSFLAPLTGKALSQRGPVIAALLADWPAIAGPSLSAFTIPEKVTRAAPAEGDSARPAGHLMLKVDPSRALDVQYMVPQLIERINQALGYKAIAAIRLTQGPVRPGPGRCKPDTVFKKNESGESSGVSRLDRALSRMANGVGERAARKA